MTLLTDKERAILELSTIKGLSDYKIARVLNSDPPNVTRTRKNALRKLKEALEHIEWAKKIGIKLEE